MCLFDDKQNNTTFIALAVTMKSFNIYALQFHKQIASNHDH